MKTYTFLILIILSFFTLEIKIVAKEKNQEVNFINKNISSIQTGIQTGWIENASHFLFDNYTDSLSGIDIWWSIGSDNTAWFYGEGSTILALAEGITDIREIENAGSYTFNEWSLGPVHINDFVIFSTVDRNYYAVFKVDSIYNDGNFINVTWYFQNDHSSDFSSFTSQLTAQFFTINFYEGIAPYYVSFTDLSTSTDTTTILTWEWDFDSDGSIDSWERNPDWIFDEGIYTVTLSISDGINVSTNVVENFLTVFSENTMLFVYHNAGYEWSEDYIYSRYFGYSGGSCYGCHPFGLSDFDLTWGPLQIPESRKILFHHYEACAGGDYNIYISTTAMGEGVLSKTINSNYCDWSDTIEINIPVNINEEFYFRINNYSDFYPNADIVKFRIEPQDNSTNVSLNNDELKSKYDLIQNFPNPFNPVTKISFSIPKPEVVQIIVYDILGKEIKSILNEYKQAGTYEFEFDASILPSGVYLYRMISANYSETKKMLLLR